MSDTLLKCDLKGYRETATEVLIVIALPIHPGLGRA